MRFREFYKLSEARFNAGQIKRHGLGKPTTLRREIEGWEVWFRDKISEQPEHVRQMRRVLHALDDRKLSKEILEYIRHAVKTSLTQSNKLSLNKFQKAATFRGTGIPLSYIYSADRGVARQYEKFAKVVKSLNFDEIYNQERAHKDLYNHNGEFGETLTRLAKSMRVDFMSANKLYMRRFQNAVLRLIELLTEFDLPSELVEKIEPNATYNWIQRQMQQHNYTAGTAPLEFQTQVVNDIRRKLLDEVKFVIDSFKTYHVRFKEPEVQSIIENVKKALESAIIRIIAELGSQGTGHDWENLSRNMLWGYQDKEKMTKTIEEYLANDIKEFVNGFVGNVRMSRRDIKDTTTDGLVYYLANRAVAAIRDISSEAVKAGQDTDETQFQAWVEKGSQNFTRVARSLQAIGVRKFARVPVIFNYQDWNERWSSNKNVSVAGLHHLGDQRMGSHKKPPDMGGQPYYNIGPQKHEHFIQIFGIDTGTIAHEIGHAVYSLLPKEQQEQVRNMANFGPSPSMYGSPEYVYAGANRPSYAHSTGNEWFAEMLELLAMRPELLNTPIVVGRDTREFAPRGSDQPLANFPDKPHPLTAKKQVRGLNDMVRQFKQIFATQANAYRGYKLNDQPRGNIRLPRRLRPKATSPQPPTPQQPSLSNPAP